MKKRLLIFCLSVIASSMGIGAACGKKDSSGEPGTSSSKPTEISLNGFEIPDAMNVYYGSCIDVYLPLVTDNIGNAVDVNYTVKDGAGASVKVEYGKFFGLDEDGYTIEYVATTVDGKTHKKTQTIKVINSYINEEAVLIDVKGKTSYDMIEAFPEEYRTGIANLRGETTTTIEFIPQSAGAAGEMLTTTEVDVSEIKQGYYKLAIKAPMGSDGVQADVYSTYLDFYDSTQSMIWADNAKLDIEQVYTKADGMTKKIVTENLPVGAKASEYFYITDDGGAGQFIFAVSGAHSPAYYEMWKEKGVTTLLVDIYYTTETCPWDISYFYSHSDTFKNIKEGEWLTFEFPLEHLISNFDKLAAIGNVNFTANMMRAGYDDYDYQMYVGNFRGKVEGSLTDSALNLADVKGAFDIVQMLKDNGKTDTASMIEQSGNLGELVLEIDGVVTTDVSKLDGVHTITAKRGGLLLYSGQADFYNSDDGMVWADNASLDLDKVYTKTSGMTKEIVTEDLPAGAQESQYYYITDKNDVSQMFIFAIGGAHSVEYYQMWLEKGVTTLLVDVYWTSESCPWDISHFNAHSEANQNRNEGEWITLELSLETLIANYKHLNNTAVHAFEANIRLGYNEYDYQLYIGNFRAKTGTNTVN